MNVPVLSPISPIFPRSSVLSVSSSTSRRRGLLRTSAPVLLALVLGVGLAGCDDVSSAGSDAASSVAPAESQQDTGGGDSADSEEAPAEESSEEPAAEPTDDSRGGERLVRWLGFGGGLQVRGELRVGVSEEVGVDTGAPEGVLR